MATAPDPFGEDILAACEDAFGVSIQFSRDATVWPETRVIFDRQAKVLEAMEDGTTTSRRVPLGGVRQSSLPAGYLPQQNDTVAVAGGTWRITDVQPDGMGSITLVLSGRPRSESSAP